MEAKLTYFNHIIEITLPDPEESDTVYVSIARMEGTYNEELYNSYVADFQFTAESNDPNNWILEAVGAAIKYLNVWGHTYCTNLTNNEVTVTDEDLDDIPF